MKKLFAILAISFAIASCGNSADAPATPNADSLKAADSAAAAATPAIDTTKMAADTTKKAADTTAKMSADTSKKK